MAWYDLDIGSFGVNLPDTGGWSLPSTNFNLGGGDWKFNLGDWGGSTGGGGGGGGFQWPSWLPGGLDLAKFGLQAGLGIKSQFDNAAYMRDMRSYTRAKQQQEKEYNDAVLAYQKQRAGWEQQMVDQFGEVFGQFGEQMGAFQETIGGILKQQIDAATPLLAQSKELLEPAVAALARGEVPELFRPILDQAKARARAAALQGFESAGIDSGTAMASMEPMIDQQAQQMLLAAATSMLTGGQQLATTGGGFLSNAVGTAQAGMSPIMAEFQLMMQSLNGLFGGMPGLTAGTPPPVPVA